MHYWFIWASFIGFNTQVKKNLNPLCTSALVMRINLQFCQNTCFPNIIVESNFAELGDFFNIDRICFLEVAWILEDIKHFSDSFDFFFLLLAYLCDVFMLL